MESVSNIFPPRCMRGLFLNRWYGLDGCSRVFVWMNTVYSRSSSLISQNKQSKQKVRSITQAL